jgi:glucose/mannose transport system permease protein
MAMMALVPAAIIVGLFYYGFIGWTVVVSLSASRLLPRYEFVGLRNYLALLDGPRFPDSFANLIVYTSLLIVMALTLGLLLAILIDRMAGGMGRLYRVVFLTPLSVSWLVTGLVWQWVLNPDLGLERGLRSLGFPGFRFGVLVQPDTAIYVLSAAGVWHVTGMVMVLFLAGLRGVDPDLWKAARIEGIPVGRTYLHIVLPILRPYVLTAIALLLFTALRSFDLVVALTGGGPGFATDLPALFIYDYIFARGRLGVGAAGAVVLMLTVLVALAPTLAITLRRHR